MELVFSRLPPEQDLPAEVVERKGIGHPDTICDALAEALSAGLSRFYLQRFGAVLHHNVDKVLLWAGESRPRFGGGQVLQPMQIFLAGRATLEHGGVKVPVESIALRSCREWFARHFQALDFDAHVRVHALVRPGSAELVEVFQRERGRVLANDTSLGVGFAPLSPLERATLAIEQAISGDAARGAHPSLGQDVKVMAARVGERVEFTIGCAMVDRHLDDMAAYLAARREVIAIAREAGQRVLGQPPSVLVNAADEPSRDSIFLTVTGTSAEAGDDGQAGRGNRCNGLITPDRPMTLESVAGKNPISHVGKLYNVLGHRIAGALVKEVEEVRAAQCLLLSRIGHPIDDPSLVRVGLLTTDPGTPSRVRDRARQVVQREIRSVTGLWKEFLAGNCRVA